MPFAVQEKTKVLTLTFSWLELNDSSQALDAVH